MPAIYSPQYSKIVGSTYDPLKPNELSGRVRVAFFEFLTQNPGYAIGDILYLTRLPKGARMIGGNLAFGTMGAGTTIKIGINGDDDRYLTDTSLASAGQTRIADTTAHFYGEELSSETDLFGTIGGAAYAAGQPLRGHIVYVID